MARGRGRHERSPPQDPRPTEGLRRRCAMSETSHRPPLRLLKFTPARRKDIGGQISGILQLFRQKSPAHADRLELALKLALAATLDRFVDQIEAENGGAV